MDCPKNFGNNKCFCNCLKIYPSLSFPSYFSTNELIRMQQRSTTYLLNVKKVNLIFNPKIIYADFEIEAEKKRDGGVKVSWHAIQGLAHAEF